jgi:hypothetical protein
MWFLLYKVNNCLIKEMKVNFFFFYYKRFFTHQVAARAANLLNGASLDFRPIRVDWDTGDSKKLREKLTYIGLYPLDN